MSDLTATGMIVNGKVVPCGLPVYNWNDHGLQFKPGDGARSVTAKQIVDLAVWHWTGGSGSYERLYKVLDNRELGVEFYIEGGKIYQFADPLKVDCFAAGRYNPRSLSIEVENYGFRDDPRDIPKETPPRAVLDVFQNGKKRKFAEFYEMDLKACAALATAISDAIPSIPRTTPSLTRSAPYNAYIGHAKMRKISGHVGHYHISDVKSDPGPQLLSYLVTAGAATYATF